MTQPGFDLPSRLRASTIHFGLSLLVGALAATLVFGAWYPTPFREISGGRDLFTLIVSVDLVLGPLITFAVFSRSKPVGELRRDLAVVVALQLAALGYGMHTVWVARPAYMVFEVDRFRVVRAIDIDPVELQRALPAFRSVPMFGPELIAAQPPTDSAGKLKSIELALAGVDINLRPETWHPYSSARDVVVSRAKPLTALMAERPDRSADIRAAVRSTGRPTESLGYLPIVAREEGWSVLVDRQTAEVVGYLPFGGF